MCMHSACGVVSSCSKHNHNILDHMLTAALSAAARAHAQRSPTHIQPSLVFGKRCYRRFLTDEIMKYPAATTLLCMLVLVAATGAAAVGSDGQEMVSNAAAAAAKAKYGDNAQPTSVTICHFYGTFYAALYEVVRSVLTDLGIASSCPQPSSPQFKYRSAHLDHHWCCAAFSLTLCHPLHVRPQLQGNLLWCWQWWHH